MAKRVYRRLLAFMLAMVMTTAFVPVMPAGAATSGECGDNLTWTLDDEGTLTISGTGEMTNWYWSSSSVPWYDSRNSISSVIIGDGVTKISEVAFSECVGLTTITVKEQNENYTSIDGVLFNKEKTELILYPMGNKKTQYTIPDGVITVGEESFEECIYLTDIIIPDSVTIIGEGAFSGCNIEKIVMGNGLTTLENLPLNDTLKEIAIGEGITIIEEDVFEECVNLTSIIMTDSVTTISDYAFNGCRSLANIEIPNSVTTIGDYAFSDCDILASIGIPRSVTRIAESAFSGCEGLINIVVEEQNKNYTSIDGVLFNKDKTELIYYPMGNISTQYTIPDSVTTINDYAFEGCRSLTNIEIPNSVITIGEDVFIGCISLTNIVVEEQNKNYTSIDGVLFNKSKTELICYPMGNKATQYTIPDSVTIISEDAFYDCINLMNIEIPNSVTSIGEAAFIGCTSLSSIEIPNSVITIGDCAFWDCISLKGVELSNSITTIGEAMFINCESIAEIEIPNSVTTIGDSAFSFCASLKSIKLPNNITRIGNNTFHGCESLTDIEIPSNVTAIGDGAFANCTNLTNITIPNGVKTIGSRYIGLASVILGHGVGISMSGAFDNCTALTSITIPDSVTAIGKGTFSGCTNLTNIKLPSSITSISNDVFYKCTNLANIIIPDSVAIIGEDAFSGCVSLKNIEFPDSVTTIGDDAFRNCNIEEIVTGNGLTTLENLPITDKLKKIVLGTGINKIDKSAFAGCGNLTSVTIPNSVTTIGDYAFEDCVSLTSIIIPNSVTTIGDYAFFKCARLASITIENGVTTIGERAFQCCASLERITLPDSIASIDLGVFGLCTNLESIIISNNVTTIEIGAFYGCNALTNITIPNSVISIGNSAFENCTSLTSIEIPNSVTSIGDFAFYDCDSLTNVYYTGTEEEWNNINIGDENDSLLSATIHFINEGDESENTEYEQEYISTSDNAKNGDIEIDSSSNASRPYHNNVVSSAETVTGDYIVKNSELTIDGSLKIDGKLYVENATVYVKNELTVGCIEIASGGKVFVRSNGNINSGYICVYGGNDNNSGGYFSIDNGCEVYADEVSVYDWARIRLMGKLYASNFIIKTSNTNSSFGADGELWLRGNFTQKNNGALWWSEGNNNFCPSNGFSVILENVINGSHSISFDNPNQSWLYNLYVETGKDNNYANTWTGNPTIKGVQKNIYKTANGYAVHKVSNSEVKAVIEQFTKDIHSALENSRKSVKIGYGISEFGLFSNANNALKEYLYAYVSGIQAIYPTVINVGVHTWYETIPVYYDGKYRDIKFTFEVVDVLGQRCVNIKYTYGKSVNQQCFAFMIADKTELADAISKYALDEYNDAIASYLMLLPNEYVKNKNSKLTKLLWNGVQDFKVGSFGYKIDGGKKYVKDFIKVGIDEYLNKVEKSVKGASLFTDEIEDAVDIDIISEVMPKGQVNLLSDTPKLMSSDGVFEDAELEAVIKEIISADGEITADMLAGVEEMDLAEKYITNISGIENCTNLKKINLNGNSVSDLSPLADMASLEEIELSGNLVSDLSPLAGLTNLKKLILKNNHISDITALDELVLLEEIDLSYNTITDISALSNMSVLSTVNITSNSVSDLSPLANVTEMKKLYLGKNEVESISPVSGIAFSVLDLSENMVSDISGLDVSELTVLDISANCVTDISILSDAYKIRELTLGGNVITDLTPISDKLAISKLNINGCGLSDISALGSLTRIKELECADNSIEDFSVLSGMTRMEKLNVSGQEIDDFSFIKTMTKLLRFDAEQCGLYSSDLNSISDTVEYLNIASNRMCDLSEIIRFSNLKILNISDNFVTDISPLLEMSALESVDYSNNAIEDKTIEEQFDETVTIIDKNAEIALEDFYFASDSADIIIGGEVRLKESTIPADASGYVLLWESDNTDVAEVNSNGIVTGKAVGSAVITATTEDGECIDSYTVNVTESMIYNTSLSDGVAKLTVKNISDTDYNSAVVTVVLYDNGEIKGIKIVNVDEFKKDTTQDITAEFDDVDNDDYLQIFLWESFETMRPIVDVYSVY